MYAHNAQRGFIALVSAVIISAVLLMAAITGSLGGFYTRFTVLNAEFKEQSSALADACTSVLLFTLGEDAGYAGPSLNYPVGSDACTIFAASKPGASPRIFTVQGVYQHAYTNLRVVVDVDTLMVISRQETAN